MLSNHQIVLSSNLASVAYNEATHTLEVRFKSGGIYQYSNVPPDIYRALMDAPSKGQFFASHIKGVYHYREVG